jgi:tripartite-type tricarboxylate transporter receptor subunit TctC
LRSSEAEQSKKPGISFGRLSLCLLPLVALAVPLGLARGQAVQPFFQGKTINYYVGFAGGGAYDFYARVAARFLGRHIPGNPTIVVQNMPGAGSLQAAGFLYWNAPRDGTAIGTVSLSMALEEALHAPGVRYHAAEFTWIGRITNSLEVMAVRTDTASSVAEARRVEVTVSATGAGSPSEAVPRLLNALAGTRFRLISGFGSSGQGMLALERGEVDGVQSSWDTLQRSKEDWLRSHYVSIVYQCATERDPELPDVPSTVELGLTKEARDILAFYTASAELGQSILAPPGIPSERAAELRAGFDALLKDRDFLTEVAKTHVTLRPANAETLQRIVTATTNAPRAITDRIAGILNAKYADRPK